MWPASIPVSKQIRPHDKNVKQKQMTHRGYLLNDVSPGCDEASKKVMLSQRWGSNVFNCIVHGQEEFEEPREDDDVVHL